MVTWDPQRRPFRRTVADPPALAGLGYEVDLFWLSARWGEPVGILLCGAYPLRIRAGSADDWKREHLKRGGTRRKRLWYSPAGKWQRTNGARLPGVHGRKMFPLSPRPAGLPKLPAGPWREAAEPGRGDERGDIFAALPSEGWEGKLAALSAAVDSKGGLTAAAGELAEEWLSSLPSSAESRRDERKWEAELAARSELAPICSCGSRWRGKHFEGCIGRTLYSGEPIPLDADPSELDRQERELVGFSFREERKLPSLESAPWERKRKPICQCGSYWYGGHHYAGCPWLMHAGCREINGNEADLEADEAAIPSHYKRMYGVDP